jgi:hypothetical protein
MTLRIEFGRAGDCAGEDERRLPDDEADLQAAKDFITAAKRFKVFAIELKLWGDEELEDDPEDEDDEGETVAFLGVAEGILLSWYGVEDESEAAQLVRTSLKPMHALGDPYRRMPQSARGTVMSVRSADASDLGLIRDAIWDLRRDVAAIKERLGCDEEEEEGDEDEDEDGI